MSCNNKVLRKRKNGTFVLSQCKTCMGCRNTRREEFSRRLQLDYIAYGYVGSFITLTYRNSDLPQLLPLGSAVVGAYFKNTPPGTLYRPHLNLFLDNLNHKVKKLYGRPIKYVCTGEYGEEQESFRPHYHGIVIGLPTNSRQLLLDTWDYGLVDIAPITKSDIRYTLGYIDKQMYGADALYSTYGDYHPPFANFSKGLGMEFFKHHKDKFSVDGKFFFSGDNEGNFFQLNTYYRKKYGMYFPTPGIVSADIRQLANNNHESFFDTVQRNGYLQEQKILSRSRLHGIPIENTILHQNWRSSNV